MQIHFKTTDESHFTFDQFRREITDYDGKEKTVIIPSQINGMEVVSIGPDAFWNKGITSVLLPPTLSVIGFYSFAFNKLRRLYIPESINLIEDGAFMYNELKELRIGYNLFTIPHTAFYHNNLSKVVLPPNTQEIQSHAFDKNPITDLVFEGAPTFIHRHAFNLGAKDMARVNVTGVEAAGLRSLLDHHAAHIDHLRSLQSRYL